MVGSLHFSMSEALPEGRVLKDMSSPRSMTCSMKKLSMCWSAGANATRAASGSHME